MQKWEYLNVKANRFGGWVEVNNKRVEPIGKQGTLVKKDVYPEWTKNETNVLNHFGSQGWELVSFISEESKDGIDTGYHAVFKRQKG